MPQFRFRAVTPAGQMVTGEVEAPSREEVIRRIEYLGHLPIEAKIVTQKRFSFTSGSKTPGSRDVTIFLRQLGLLVSAGLTLEAALQTLADDTNKSVAQFADELRASISSGQSFSEALERYPSIIQPAYVSMIHAGEASGKLDGVLRAIVKDRTRQEMIGERVNSTIRYPLILIVSAISVLLFFLIYIIPQFDSVFSDLGTRLNAGAAFALTASMWLRTNFDLCIGGMIAFVLGAWVVFHDRNRRNGVLAILAKLPGIAGPMRDRQTARLVGTLGLLAANGVSLPAALKILRNVVTEPRYVSAIDRLHDQVRNGRRFADALAETDLLPPLAARMLRVGDETGDLASVASHAAEFYEHRLSLGLDRLMGAVGPAAIVVVSIVIGALIVSIMTALYSITDLAQ